MILKENIVAEQDDDQHAGQEGYLIVEDIPVVQGIDEGDQPAAGDASRDCPDEKIDEELNQLHAFRIDKRPYGKDTKYEHDRCHI